MYINNYLLIYIRLFTDIRSLNDDSGMENFEDIVAKTEGRSIPRFSRLFSTYGNYIIFFDYTLKYAINFILLFILFLARRNHFPIIVISKIR